jgi:hypothetical protein
MQKFTAKESQLFYLYLVIKSNFRSELIQNNHLPGFRNFASFQDRKNQFFGVFDEYWVEAQRLSVCGGIKDNNIISLEARIMPKSSAHDMKMEIARLDKMICFAGGKELKNLYYYVVHFPKKNFSQEEFQGKFKRKLLIPRNVETRKNNKAKAIALATYLNRYDLKDSRVWGIDACSYEIGCRPETFATEFRYLRSMTMQISQRLWNPDGPKVHPGLGITYHVGEDFLDIVDGLRAIDETLHFLPMKKGDRLGHALALGIIARDYYAYKRNSIYLTKQDYLDNLIWVLYRSLELNVSIESDKRMRLQNIASELFHEIYYSSVWNKSCMINVLDAYYHSWHLRGDHPDLYKSGKCGQIQGQRWFPYRQYMKAEDGLEQYRKDEVVSELYYLYHFDTTVKVKGLKPIAIQIEPWWVEIVEEIQRAMRKEIYNRGIAIECNPTSNVLIGTFQRYDKHPITVFNNYHLVHDDEPNMMASVNTDDLGVFDTSAQNEYALLFASIAGSRHKENNYEDDVIYEYLDYLRENGINMAFKDTREIMTRTCCVSQRPYDDCTEKVLKKRSISRDE